METTETMSGAVIETPDGLLVLPTYVPTVEETIKASGGHRQAI